MHDYIDKPTPIRQNIKGINNTPAQITGVGKGSYKILDNKGRQHTFIIDKTVLLRNFSYENPITTAPRPNVEGQGPTTSTNVCS
jgi:hypothetical protein